MPSPANVSPAKKIISLKGLISFLQKKMQQNQTLPSFTVCPQEQVTFHPAKPKLSITILPSISIPPILPKPRAVHENQPIATETYSEPSNPEPPYPGTPNSEPQNPEPPNPEPVGEDFKNESVNQFKVVFYKK
jgi:hypothetical protein